MVLLVVVFRMIVSVVVSCFGVNGMFFFSDVWVLFE